MPIKFTMPEKLVTFDFEKIILEAEIQKNKIYEKPVTYLSLLHTNQDGTKTNVPVMSAGNLSAIQGKAKSRKTFFLVLASSMILKQNNIKIAIFDTEQYNYHSSLTLRRINLLNPDNNLKFFNLRKYAKDIRFQFVQDYIVKKRPDLIFLDNIRDCMIDYNSAKETDSILTPLIQLADEYKTHICVTLHENPGVDNNKARGVIGTELQNKAETVLQASLEKEDRNYTRITGLFTRNMCFDDLQFRISDDGLPELVSEFCAQSDEKIKPF